MHAWTSFGWYARLSTVLNHTFDRRQPLVLYGSQAEFTQTNVVSGMLSDSIGGVTESSKRRIVMPFAPTLAETDRVIGHELVHAFQFDIARRHGRDTSQPLWFIEGMAEYLAKGPLTGGSTLWVRDAVLTGRLPEKIGTAARDLSRSSAMAFAVRAMTGMSRHSADESWSRIRAVAS